MPYSGGVVDQPNDAIRRLEIILTVIRELEDETSKKQEARQELNDRLGTTE